MKNVLRVSAIALLAASVALSPAPAHAGFLDSLKKVLNPFSSPKDKIEGHKELAEQKKDAVLDGAKSKFNVYKDGAENKLDMAKGKFEVYRDGAEDKFSRAQDKAELYKDGAEDKFNRAQDKAELYKDGAEDKFNRAQDKAELVEDNARDLALARLVTSPEGATLVGTTLVQGTVVAPAVTNAALREEQRSSSSKMRGRRGGNDCQSFESTGCAN